MNATIAARTPTSSTLQVEVPYNDSMLDLEETLQQRLDEAGVAATAEGLRQLDTDGSRIAVGPVEFTTKGQVEKDYRTPYGVATVGRHAYQGPRGGPTSCPPDRDARVVASSTPRFAEVISPKYAEFSSPRVRIDLGEDHGRSVSRCPIQDVADAVAAAATAEEEGWGYALPKFGVPPVAAAIGLDGACMLTGEGGWREAMVGTPSFDDEEGERKRTIYLAATPEYGEAKSLGRMEAEIDRARAECPEARYVGVADGAKGNREFLGRHADVQVTDDWHAAEYLGEAAAASYRGHPRSRGARPEDACHRPKHEPDGAGRVPERLRTPARERPWAEADEDVRRAITYLANQSGAGRMDHAGRAAASEPIGSGVTEAACEVIVERRLCGSGMRWTEEGPAVVPGLRAPSYTPGRWGRSWSRVDRWGLPVAAWAGRRDGTAS